MENLSEIKILRDSEIDAQISQYFQGSKLCKKGKIATFSGLLERKFDVVNTPFSVLFVLPFKPIVDYIWVFPFFTIRKNGNFEVGTYANFNKNKITEPLHLNFTYICE